MMGFLKDCHKIESLAGTVYRQLSRDGSYSDEVRSLFLQLATDEKTHAEQIDMFMRAPDSGLKAVASVSGAVLDATVRFAEEIVAKLERGSLTEDDALRLAVEMERRFVKVHVHNALFSRNERLAALLAGLRGEDEIHLDRLRECLRRLRSERRQHASPP